MVLASALVLGGSTLISGCTTSDNELVVENDKTPSVQKAGTFTFQLNGTKARSSFAPVSRAEDAHEFESDIKTVYVAFFTKKENTEESTLKKLYINDSGDASNGATITKADDGSYTITDENLFTGDYIAYFIANPGTKLKTSLNNLTTAETTSKLSDFKKISIEDTPNGDDTKDSKDGTGLVMISDEMNITITEDKTISNITMTRLGARFDIINTQPATGEDDQKHGATITNVTITNEAVKSALIVPAANTDANNLSTKEATTWSANDTEMTFYTYENFPKTEERNNNTSLTVTYTLDASSTSKTLTIYLTDKNTGAQLGVKRNHLYSIYLNCVTGQYTLSVKDWETGETVNLPDKNIYVEYTADDLGKIGDYAYNDNGTLAFIDGGLRKMYLNGDLDWESNFTTTLPEDKDYLGIVFSNLTSATDYNAGYTNGYIMAAVNVKPSSGTVAWGPSTDDSPIPNISDDISKAMHLDGRTNCDAIKNVDPSILNSYPPIKAAVEYQAALPTLTKVSGWFLPSMGQLLTMFSNLCENGEIHNLSGSIGDTGFKYSFKNNNYANKFNERFSRIPDGSKYLLSTDSSVHFTSSDESSESNYGYFFLTPKDNYMLIKSRGTKNNIGGAQVRPVFAF